MRNYDLIIVGGGILGLSHAYHALKKKLSVLLIEKNHQAQDASVRNFGQIVPSGFGAIWQQYGIRSTRHYLDIASQYDISLRQEGSIYLASNDDELQLIEELHHINIANDYFSLLLSSDECKSKYPMLQPSYCKGGLFYPQEINVDSRNTLPAITSYLVEKMGLDISFGRGIIDIYTSSNQVLAVDIARRKWTGTHAIVCNGNDYTTLFSEVFPTSDIKLVKLQMLETIPQKSTVPGSVLTGWTIRRYESFQECPSFPDIKAKEDHNAFHHLYGVHILFKQTAYGSIILGDSHEYAYIEEKEKIMPRYTNQVINDFIVAEARKIMHVDYTTARSWNGYYSQSNTKPIFQKTIDNRIHIVSAIGGKGMTASLGWAEDHIESLFSS